MEKELEEKLKTFENIVLGEAKEKGECKLDKVEKDTNETLEKKETEYLSEAYDAIQKKIRGIRRGYNEKVLHAEVEARRQLLKAREDIVAGVFDECAAQLAEFRKSEEYKPWLCRKLENAVKELGSGRISAALSESDKYLDTELKELYPEISFSYEPDGIISGGVKVYNSDRRTAADYTLAALLEAQKSEFLQTGGLAIN
ncbi:MAG: V-type ATP synthase subunit E [Clostridia bacterium]|nr:V-type ATP synthase subunit E [Clostridia bacterium]